MFTNEQVSEFAKAKGYTPGTILWATDKPLEEDAFRSGSKSSAAIDFLRWQDIGLEDSKGTGRIPEEEQSSHFVAPGRGISLFIKRMLPEGMTYAGTAPDATKSVLKKQFDPLHERSWWKIESGHPIPAGLCLVFDGEPPGHCTLTVDREVSVKQLLGLVGSIRFAAAGTDYFGIQK